MVGNLRFLCVWICEAHQRISASTMSHLHVPVLLISVESLRRYLLPVAEQLSVAAARIYYR
jgi:hypothetical protein